jgi:hypothetical protein
MGVVIFAGQLCTVGNSWKCMCACGLTLVTMLCCVAGSKYERRRSKTLLKVKTFYDEDPCLYYLVLDPATIYPGCQQMLLYVFFSCVVLFMGLSWPSMLFLKG